ncbi:beta-ketoacyl-ACP synthase [Gilvimarinus sp. SDUM040013]|uniref:Beta-ketoacyl-ACP synthase n=1 Tax=Gilvimarinus gilvus TaxID=3058038 RepID=A0ABU4S228_9GAMM|nr:beta-ketoacyl-ACP synthase [Gilvimarinus sp. SDUM040013]MDO3387782.1 beta-ketoacyl-ACP synthase [Gilvimarinus sp. SDUM040013]MDX6851075.1 beta-ketoacyl-ACP synthase [Gilvimarinus sp. SDUM040013]
MRRVAITGVGAVSALGNDWNSVEAGLRAGKNKVQAFAEWDAIEGLNTRLGAPLEFTTPKHYPRKKLRSMGRVSVMAVDASERALAMAGLIDDPLLKSGRVGVSYGSCIGTPGDVPALTKVVTDNTTVDLTASTYLRTMTHTATVNIGLFFGMTGRIIPTASACTSGSQGIGYAYEAIKYGMQDVMVAGGAEEFHVTPVAVFDTLFATSTSNDTPELTPRPFDKDRDGLVLGEGACSLILEDYEHAKARGANILGEIVGYGTNSDGAHVTEPRAVTMADAMRMALDDAQLSADDIGYVNAHGTATSKGDVAESQATCAVLGEGKPISSLKSYIGHTLGACGALEAWMTLEMMHSGWFAPTINLDNIDPECAPLDYITGNGLELDCQYAMSNNFAFGGVNTSLIIKRGDS